jgi:hypothetical protein
MLTASSASFATTLTVGTQILTAVYAGNTDIHDKSLSSGARMSVGALESACLYLGSVISSRLSLSAGFLRNAEPEIHSLYRVLRTVTED